MTMSLRMDLMEVQIPVLAAMLLIASGTKAAQLVRRAAADEAFGPTALFPVTARRPVAIALCAIELCLGIGLILTADEHGSALSAKGIRIASVLLFVVATAALIELRATRPDVGCGCFGDFSRTPVGFRALARAALLAIAALVTLTLGPVQVPQTWRASAGLVGILFAELLLIAALSPEIGEGLIRLGYSEPCELQVVPSQRTLSALHRSKQWRVYSPLVASDAPADVWRELCWRYVVYPARHHDRQADLVFAVYLKHRRPVIRAALVDAATGRTLPWPAAAPSRSRLRRRDEPLVPQGAAIATGQAVMPVRADLPLSTDV